MNGGDLHYHLSQHGVFNESEMKFYAAEVSDRIDQLVVQVAHTLTKSNFRCLPFSFIKWLK